MKIIHRNTYKCIGLDTNTNFYIDGENYMYSNNYGLEHLIILPKLINFLKVNIV